MYDVYMDVFSDVVYINVNINSLCIFMLLNVGECLVRVSRVNSGEVMHEVVFKQQ